MTRILAAARKGKKSITALFALMAKPPNGESSGFFKALG
jgi:hypothetical protein